MKQNISELAQTIYRVKQESDKVLDLHFARVFKKSIIGLVLFFETLFLKIKHIIFKTI